MTYLEALYNYRTSVQDLPSEIICEILSRLPIVSLLRCKAVCKRWEHETKGPQFMQMHILRASHHQNQIMLVPNFVWPEIAPRHPVPFYLLDDYDDRQGSWKRKEVPLHKGVKGVELRSNIIGSCNGLLCIVKRVNYPNYARSIIVFNPITGETLKLSSLVEKEIKVNKLIIGFGFDSINHVHKVVCIYRKRGATRGMIISVGRNMWRELQVPVPFNVGRQLECPKTVFHDGAFHWLINGETILALDITTEQFYTIPLTSSADPPNPKYSYLVEFTKSLAVVQVHNIFHYFCVWELVGSKKDGSLKVKTYTVKLDSHIDTLYGCEILGMLGSGNFLLKLRGSWESHHLLVYNEKEKRPSRLEAFPVGDFEFPHLMAPTLVSPNSIC